MAADRTQRRDLAASHLERVAELATAHQRWAASHQVVPWETLEHERPWLGHRVEKINPSEDCP